MFALHDNLNTWEESYHTETHCVLITLSLLLPCHSTAAWHPRGRVKKQWYCIPPIVEHAAKKIGPTWETRAAAARHSIANDKSPSMWEPTALKQKRNEGHETSPKILVLKVAVWTKDVPWCEGHWSINHMRKAPARWCACCFLFSLSRQVQYFANA